MESAKKLLDTEWREAMGRLESSRDCTKAPCICNLSLRKADQTPGRDSRGVARFARGTTDGNSARRIEAQLKTPVIEGRKGKTSAFHKYGCQEQRRARESNPQPVSRHHISSVAASHSLTLRTIAHEPMHSGSHCENSSCALAPCKGERRLTGAAGSPISTGGESQPAIDIDATARDSRGRRSRPFRSFQANNGGLEHRPTKCQSRITCPRSLIARPQSAPDSLRPNRLQCRPTLASRRQD